MATERWFPGVNETGKLSSCERLNSVTGNWISGPEMFPKALSPRPTDGFVDRTLQSHDLLSPSQCEFFDPASDRWIAGPPMNTPRACHSLAVLDGEMFGDVKMEVREVALHWKSTLDLERGYTGLTADYLPALEPTVQDDLPRTLGGPRLRWDANAALRGALRCTPSWAVWKQSVTSAP